MIEDKMRIMAIDPADRLGWAVSNQLYGVENFKSKSGESNGFKLIKFKSFLQKVIDTEDITVIVYERPGGRFKNDIMSHAKYIAVIEIVCIERGLEYKAFSAAEIKQYATGKGNANKEAMVTAAQQRYGYTGTDDNVADALHILNLANETYNK
jgi:Holliday junction resolvasome RuvABC endonuclease subunit